MSGSEVTPSTVTDFSIRAGLELGQEFIDILEANLFRAIRIVGISKWVLMVLGLGMIGGGVGLYLMRKQKGQFKKAVSPKVTVEPISDRF